MIKEVEHLMKVSARWYDTTDPSNRRIMVSLHKGVLTISQREHPSDVWPPSVKLSLDEIVFVS